MRPRHQIRYLTSNTIERFAKELRQAVADFPEPRSEGDREMDKHCKETVDRLLELMIEEIAGLPEV